MHNSVAAIRAARVHARFVLPPAQQRERHLGLRRLAVMRRPEAPAHPPDGRGPLRAGVALRTGVVPAPTRKVTMRPLRRDVCITWSSDATVTPRRPAIRRATPWHG